jgi:CHRD domain-containing protein
MSIVRRALLAPAMVALLAGVGTARADTLLPFTAVLNGAQETPPVASPSQGMALVTYDVDTGLLCYALSFSPLTSQELVAHFHGPAAPGVAAPILFPITPSPSPVGSPKNGCVGPLSKTDVKNLKKGLLYLNVHSANFPLGEIRGQVFPEKPRYKGVVVTSTSTTIATTSTTTSTTVTSVTGAFVVVGG